MLPFMGSQRVGHELVTELTDYHTHFLGNSPHPQSLESAACGSSPRLNIHPMASNETTSYRNLYNRQLEDILKLGGHVVRARLASKTNGRPVQRKVKGNRQAMS